MFHGQTFDFLSPCALKSDSCLLPHLGDFSSSLESYLRSGLLIIQNLGPAPLQNLSGIFVACILEDLKLLPGIFLEDLSWALFPTKMRR